MGLKHIKVRGENIKEKQRNKAANKDNEAERGWTYNEEKINEDAKKTWRGDIEKKRER